MCVSTLHRMIEGHPAAAGYPARSSKVLDFNGKSARMGMASCLITVISPIRHCRAYSARHTSHRMKRCGGCAIARKTVLSAASRYSSFMIFPSYRWLTWLVKLVNALGCIRRSFISSLSICQFFYSCDPQVPYHDTRIRSQNRMVGKLV